MTLEGALLSGYVPVVTPRDVAMGDAVRKRGYPLRIGLVSGVDGDDVLVKWSTQEPAARHDYRTLQRRL